MYRAGADTSATVDEEYAGINGDFGLPASRSLQRLTTVAGGQLLAKSQVNSNCPSLLFKKQITVFIHLARRTTTLARRKKEQ